MAATTAFLPTWVRRPRVTSGPRLVHVNTHSTFGGVAELLGGLIRAQQSRGHAVGWATITGDADFFLLAKQLHYLTHGKGDPAVLRDPARAELYAAVLLPQAEAIAATLRPGDVVVLHDSHTLGMAGVLSRAGARVVWHSHVGADVDPDAVLARVWPFFAGDFSSVDAVITTRADFAPPAGLFSGTRHVIAPAIDPMSAKNRPMSTEEVAACLAEIGLSGLEPEGGGRGAAVEHTAPLPEDATLVLQVSRWDPLKDMLGALRGFARVTGLPQAHLALAGPDPREVGDDPEGLTVLDEVRAALAALPAEIRGRVHLVLLSMRDLERNAWLVNALQRRADVVLQKSLEEGFGLTVTEAMAKRRAVVAAAVGGLRLQVEHENTGLLVDPADDTDVAAALTRLLADPGLRRELGDRAAASVAERYLMPRLADDYDTATGLVPGNP
ncbi:glycosyltransferase [Amycolatopsis sp. NPDC051128]|uniref:glycosyltransferase n=1 Tax=Amycolatopsis sp. NPDC051128 TaxID=3155412 RepID=UPI0034400F64